MNCFHPLTYSLALFVLYRYRSRSVSVDPRERVCILFTNTVLRELDSQSQTNGQAFANKIRSQFRMHEGERSFLATCTRLGFVETLGSNAGGGGSANGSGSTSQALAVGVMPGGTGSGSGGRTLFPNTSNDSQILSAAENWSRELSASADVVFVTDDAALGERARLFGSGSPLVVCSVAGLNKALGPICTEQISRLNTAAAATGTGSKRRAPFHTVHDVPLTASLLRHAMETKCGVVFGGRSGAANGASDVKSADRFAAGLLAAAATPSPSEATPAPSKASGTGTSASPAAAVSALNEILSFVRHRPNLSLLTPEQLEEAIAPWAKAAADAKS